MSHLTKEKALDIFLKYNTKPYLIYHGLTVSAVMEWFANHYHLNEEADHWSIVGLLHDVDFEMYPEQHCHRAVELLETHGVSQNIIRSICSHGFEICTDVEPVHLMEKVLYATDELTGLIYSAVMMRPSKSVQDFTPKSLKKKFKDKSFAAGCSRDTIKKGAAMLETDLNTLFELTIEAMKSCEQAVKKDLDALGVSL